MRNPLEALVGPYQIQQIVSRWRKPTREVEIEQVDRCHTCHLGVDSGRYTAPSTPRAFRTHPQRGLLFGAHPIDQYGCTACHQGQGRATSELAHSGWRLVRKWGKERWHYFGDHYWQPPLLTVGTLEQVIIDGNNDALELKLGHSAKVEVTLAHGKRADDSVLYGQLEAKLQAALVELEPTAARHWHALVRKRDSRVSLGFTRRIVSPQKDAAEPLPKVALRFIKPGLARLLGFTGIEVLSAKTEPVFVAPESPSLPVRAQPAAAQGRRAHSATRSSYLPPDGDAGLQVPDEQRNRFIQALPQVQSACLRCHLTDVSLAPQRSESSYVSAKLAYQKAEAARKSDAHTVGGRSDGLPSVPPQAGALSSLAPTLDAGRDLFRRLNCRGCHKLEGFEANKDHGPGLDDIGAKLEPAWLLNWLRHPRSLRPKTNMPKLWPRPLDPASKRPVQPGSRAHAAWKKERDDETLAMAAYLIERSSEAGRTTLQEKIRGYAMVEGATAKRGKLLFERTGCQGCHAVSHGAELPEAWRNRERDLVPTLSDLAAKTSADWIAYWLEDPSRYAPSTLMPSLRLTRIDAASIAQYLVSLSPPPAATNKPMAAELATLADPAKRAQSMPCEPAGGRTVSRVACGEKLIRQRGCAGCHRISGFEDAAPIGPELSGFADKEASTLDFGYAITDHHLQTSDTFATLKLDAPRIYERDRIRLKMGDFDLSAAEIRALVVFLKGLVRAKPRAAFDPNKRAGYAQVQRGLKLIADLNCRGCHRLNGSGADIDGFREALLIQDPQRRAPWLDTEGARVQSDWLFDYLRDPEANAVRPWFNPQWAWGDQVPDSKLALRMPSYELSDEARTALVRYFARSDQQSYPFQAPRVGQLSKDERHYVLANMSSAETGNCLSCHFYGAFPVARGQDELTKMAPNIAAMADRLRPEWVKLWLLNPQNVLPYTRMLAFFASVDRPKQAHMWPKQPDPFLSPPARGWAAVLPGFRSVTGEEQATLVRDFLFSIPPNTPWPEPDELANSKMVDPLAPANRDATDQDAGTEHVQ